MEAVFEEFTRRVLARPGEGILNSYRILDGNKGTPSGGARPLFSHFTGGAPNVNNVNATPDIVITSEEGSDCHLIIDAKYKLCPAQPDRDDLNQVAVYGLTHSCYKVALLYPFRRKDDAIVRYIGTIGNIRIYKVMMDLGAESIEAEEEKFRMAVGNLVES
jgi:5-methylcytosine-specific restriction endonuclease McrBC regulatory subunit McrC